MSTTPYWRQELLTTFSYVDFKFPHLTAHGVIMNIILSSLCMTINFRHVIRKFCDHIAQTVDLTSPQICGCLQIVQLQTYELHTRVGGWMLVELMFLPIVARATHVQKKRVRLSYLCLYSGCVV
jgi:hypothetical protein